MLIEKRFLCMGILRFLRIDWLLNNHYVVALVVIKEFMENEFNW